MGCTINHIKKTIQPAASKAVGRYGRGLLVGRQARAPNRLQNSIGVEAPFIGGKMLIRITSSDS